MSDQWTERLSEHVDEALSQDDKVLLEAHLATCTECRTTLEELRAVVARARALPDRPPESDLWPGIQAQVAVLAQEAAQASGADWTAKAGQPVKGHESFRGRGFGGGLTLSWPQLAAAGIALMLVSGAASYFAAMRIGVGAAGRGGLQVAQGNGLPAEESSGVAGPGGFGTPGGTAGTASDPGRTNDMAPGGGAGTPGTARSGGSRPNVGLAGTEAGVDPIYAAEVLKLERVLSENRDELDPETVRTIESNLRIIDLASAQARKALDADPANPYLQEHLSKTMQRKIEVLKQATVFASAQ